MASPTSSTTRPILLLLGSGPNVGASTISLFISHHFRVAAVSRSTPIGSSATNPSLLNVAADLSNPSSIPKIFETVISHWGHPSAVIYNAASRTMLPPTDPLSGLNLEQYANDTNLNVTSALLTAKYAVQSFDALPESNLKTFVHTGNKLPRMPSPGVLTFGMHKSAMAHCVWDLSVAYREKGYKFYFTDQRFADGRPTRAKMSGEAAAELVLDLVQGEGQRHWYQSFVPGKGYVNFADVDREATRTGLWG